MALFDLERGEVRWSDAIRISARTTPSALLALLPNAARVDNPPFLNMALPQLETADGTRSGGVHFRSRSLQQIFIFIIPSEFALDERNLDGALALKAHYEQVLARELGPPHAVDRRSPNTQAPQDLSIRYRFAWGTVTSGVYAKMDYGAGIFVTFE